MDMLQCFTNYTIGAVMLRCCIYSFDSTTLDYYKCCEVQFKGLPNIHTVQKSFLTLRSLVSEGDPNRYVDVSKTS